MKQMLTLFVVLFMIPLIAVTSTIENTQVLKNLCTQCNVVIISLTSLRKHNMGVYGYYRNTTPNISQFFQDAYIFDHAFAPASLTYTDAISFFYSLSPIVHQNFERFNKAKLQNVLKSNISMPEIFAKNGYKTAAFVSDEDYSYDRGIGRTFQYYFDRSLYPDHDILFKPFTYSVGTKQLVPIMNKWIKENHKNKFFLFLQAFDMHCPYNPVDAFANLYPSAHSQDIPFTSECLMTENEVVKDAKGNIILSGLNTYMNGGEKKYVINKEDQEYLKSRYDAELNQTDYNLKPLFKTLKDLKLEKNTIVVLMSDHGDNLGENDFFMKMSPTAPGNLHRNNLGFPLLIKTPTVHGLKKQDQIIQSIDLAPTLIDLTGNSVSPLMQGKSFAIKLGTTKEHNDYAYAYSMRYGLEKIGSAFKTSSVLESLIGKKWKLDYSVKTDLDKKTIIKTEFFLYDLVNDPLETTNIFPKNQAVFKELFKRLELKRAYYKR